jgi:glycosyltransferase involved in cell wall biosynthesis
LDCSIVVPVHNEALNLESQVTQFVENLSAELAAVVKEILLVENGSTDGTLDVCRSLESRYGSLVRVISIARGSYGGAIKRGMLESRGTHLSILECDVLDLEFVSRSITIFRTTGVQVIVGSKRHPEAVDKRPFKRRVLTYLYNVVFLRICIGYPGTDTHGLKSLQTSIARKLCEEAITSDEVFQTEIILLAWRKGIQIREIPLSIRETRVPSISIRRRLPKVIHTVRELRNSLMRFPHVPQSASKTVVPMSKTEAPAGK